MKKKILSLFLAAVMLCGVLTVQVSASYADIPDEETAAAVAVLQSMGIADGSDTTRFYPNAVMTRAEFCVMLVRMMGQESQISGYAYKTLFSDVKPGSSYTGYVNLAYSKGLISGYGNGKFGPNDAVTYGQAAKILLQMLGYTASDVGNVWPTDYVNYADDLGLSDGLSLRAGSSLTRGETAVLICNTLKTEKNGSSNEYYRTMSGVASIQNVILLDTDAVNGRATGQLMVCPTSGNNATVSYYTQKNQIPAYLEGAVGELLLNSAGKVVGFVPSSDHVEDITISSAKVSGITAAGGATYRITSSATAIIGDDIYTWSKGYTQFNKQSGKTARLYYNDDGVITYVYLTTGTTKATVVTADVAMAESETPLDEFVKKLGVSGTYSITKNGAVADEDDLAQYDVAYYEASSKTLRVSDDQITGFIESASPALSAAQSITVSGCTLSVLESAWESLADYTLGERVTLLLTDDNKVAFATSDTAIAADMIGVLATNGRSVTLLGSGLTMTADAISADTDLYGQLVELKMSLTENVLTCTAYTSESAGELDITAGMLGSDELAPSCAVYEQTGTSELSYVYSLSGELGKASSDFSDIFWTDTVPASQIGVYHLNSAGKVDMLVLLNVTGNSYDYGKLDVNTDREGVSTVTLTNGVSTGATKYLCGDSLSVYHSGYYGITLCSYTAGNAGVAAQIALYGASDLSDQDFTLEDGTWFVTLEHDELRVSENVQIYLEATDKWLSGEDGLMSAFATEKTLSVYYDITNGDAAQVRVIVVGLE